MFRSIGHRGLIRPICPQAEHPRRLPTSPPAEACRIVLIKLVLSEKTAAIIGGSICLILAAAMFVGWRADDSLRAKLKESGKKVEASVIAARSRSVSTGKTSRMEERVLSVIYMVDLKMISKDFRVNEKGLDEHPQGSKVNVLYDPDNPEDAILAEDFALSSASTAWIGGIILSVLTIACFWYAMRPKRRAPVSPS
jgi:hypothetical protein